VMLRVLKNPEFQAFAGPIERRLGPILNRLRRRRA